MAANGVLQRFRNAVTPHLLFLMLVATLGPLQFGFHLSELNAPQDVITCKKPEIADGTTSTPHIRKLPQCIQMSEFQFALVTSMYVVGGLFGALGAGPASNKWGRPRAMWFTSIAFILGSAIQALADTISTMSVGRIIVGIGAGAATVVVPLYISEISPPNWKGLFGSMTQVTINIGILFSQTLGFFLSKGSSWRIILGVGIIIGVCQGIGLFLAVESPSWLVAQGRTRDASKILQRIRGMGVSIAEETECWGPDKGNSTTGLHEEQERLLESRDIHTPNSQSQASIPTPKPGLFNIWLNPEYRPALIAVVGIMFAQQFCGINSIMMYSVSLLSGVLPVSSAIITIIISIANLFVTIACANLPDKIGRKSCLLLSISGMGSMAFALALSLQFEFPKVAAISVILFVASFATGLGPVPFLIASELVGQEAVGIIQSWCLASNYIATLAVSLSFPSINTYLNKRFGGAGWAYLICAVMAVASFVFVKWCVPETKGKKTIEDVWGKPPKARRED